MKNNRWIPALVAITLLSSLYRVIPYDARPEWLGAPQLALAVFAGAVVPRKGFSFLVVLLSMLVSDVLMQLVHLAYPAMPAGFYEGQALNYLLIAGVTAIGFLVSSRRIGQIVLASLAAPMVYFLVSNFLVWIGGGGLGRPLTLEGLMLCYQDALPFLRNSLSGTLVFGLVFFGGYFLLQKEAKPQVAA